jgi:CrcB protein
MSSAAARFSLGPKLALAAAALSAPVGVAVALADSMSVYVAIAVGSALGGMGRYSCSGMTARLVGETFPWGTLLANVVGSFVIGFFSTLTGPNGRIYASTTARQFVIGICGGYTTFSSFSLQTLNLMNDGEWLCAAANTFGSILLCFLAAWTGHAVAANIGGLKSLDARGRFYEEDLMNGSF